MSGPSVPPLAFVQLLGSQALDPAAVDRFRSVMTREGVTETTMVEREVQAPLRWFREVYPRLDADQATHLGRVCAEQAQLTTFGPLTLPLVSAGSVAEIVELLTYLPLISTALSPKLHPSEAGLMVGFSGQTGDQDLDRFVITYCGSALLRLLTLLVGDTSSVTLHLSWATPASLTDHPDVLRGQLVFGAPISFLHVPAETLTAVCRFSDPLAYQHSIGELENALERQQGRLSYSQTVTQLLDEGNALMSSHTVAAQLATSPSTLKRRLAEEGTTFRKLRETCLRDKAVLRLLEQTATVSEVATDLGYSDLANFSHAFKRWTGQSPSQFQRTRGIR